MEVLVLVLVLVNVLVAVGGGAVSVRGGWVGVDDGLGEGSIVALGMESSTIVVDVVGELLLQPANIKINSRETKMRVFESAMIDFIS